MTIEEDFEQVRECLIGIYGKDPHAALDRIEGYIEQCADFQRAAEQERDALKEALETLIADVEAMLPAIRSAEAVARAHGMMAPYKGKDLPTAIEAARQVLAKLEEK